LKLTLGIGGNAIEEANPDRAQLIKGFQAQFWFAFGSATLGALGALTLRLGRRGTAEDHKTRKEQQRQQDIAVRGQQESKETEIPAHTQKDN